ncbi:hypothetical protein BFJ63_vAg11100 [Fusarium oxysporum f. sp. narcissi]|uniref:Secreted protein n=2 Tax=Fusarium oxysporum TaxID=5507 RepID=A0A4Q2VF77_FUSOX|nr:hypothetical protein BFJ65_g16642 [Fusarium oxysporum f. sp. cepae]RKK31186.1 hypothetical protein BFJ67_g15359 [Fusarium oxysporum f. sp. cepae]RKK35120.1 hypothetical protein BFJ66_g14111 [Fusarium oxysporum f. sp. cepae]RKK98470.1 hypothetical protein BFJ71_g6823 [Fusarium oxysporum]RYC86074.1 hypothetical protein BFJ63_vAg11100 [Fusarium oxysporum f. sp. narcissi]
MRLLIASIVTLAVTSQVTALYVTFYDNTERCEVDGETEYQILEYDQFYCNTFGASMDGVDCVHFVEGGRNRKDCKGLFKAQSAKPKLNINSYCKFYPYADCREFGIDKESRQCATTMEMCLTNGEKSDYIASFRCQVERWSKLDCCWVIAYYAAAHLIILTDTKPHGSRFAWGSVNNI